MAQQAFDAKVVLLGHSGVGKTSLVVRYVQGVFEKSTKPTVGPSFWTKRVVIDNWKVTLQIWDTCGQERFKSMTPMYYRGAQAVLFVYDVTNRESLEGIKEWVTELNNNGISTEDVVMVIAANKSDLEVNSTTKKTNEELGQEYAKSIKAKWYATSAKNNLAIEEMFAHMSRELIQHSKGAKKPDGYILDGKRDAPDEDCSC